MKGFLRTILWTLLYLGIYFAVSFTVIISTAFYASITGNMNLVTNSFFDINLLFTSILSTICFMLIFRKKITSEMKKIKSKNDLKNILLISLCTGIILFGLVNYIISISKSPINGVETLTKLTSTNIFMVITVVIFAPLLEEILFRGLIFNKAKENLSFKLAILIQAVTFSVVHGNLIQGIYAFFLGIIFALIYEKTETLWVPTLMHITHNFINLVLAAVIPESLSHSPIIILVIGIMPIPLLFILLHNMEIIRKKAEAL